MSLTKEEIATAIVHKKALSALVEKSGCKKMSRADKVYHENCKRWCDENDAGDLVQTLGGDT